jgi:hypothetical protein
MTSKPAFQASPKCSSSTPAAMTINRQRDRSLPPVISARSTRLINEVLCDLAYGAQHLPLFLLFTSASELFTGFSCAAGEALSAAGKALGSGR